MNNELLKFEKDCENLDAALHDKYYELEGLGASDKELNDLVDEMYVLRDIYKEGKEDVIGADLKLKRFARELKKKYNLVLVSGLGREVKAVPTGINKEEEKPVVVKEAEKEAEKEDKPTPGAYLAGIIAASIACGGIGYAIGNELKKKEAKNANHECEMETEEENINVVEPTVEESINEKLEDEFNLNSSIEPEHTNCDQSSLVLGEYGTFLDATNKEQVEARAKYIVDTYYGPFMGKLTDYERSFITVENVANVIRVMNGELPVDANGNVIMNANIVDDYGQTFTYLFGDLGSSPNLEGIYYNVPAYMFTTDGTELQAFIKRYDEDYQKMTEGFNVAACQRYNGENIDGGVMVREAIASLGYKYWNEWCLKGVYGDTNPYNFEAKYRLYAFLSCFARYGQWAFEYNLNAMQPVCIDACINYSTKEIEKLNVNEIFWGYCNAEWNKVIAQAAGIESNIDPDSVYFTQDLLDELTWKYNNMNCMSLK